LLDGTAEEKRRDDDNPQSLFKDDIFQECNGHQTGYIFAVHGGISLDGPKVGVLLGSVDISIQTGDERLHRPHEQHIFNEE
jgi:hypothetical protein